MAASARATGQTSCCLGACMRTQPLSLTRSGQAGRIFCIASAGCTAIKLASRHEVVAADINSIQLAYVKHRLTGGSCRAGTAERILAFVRTFGPVAGWSASRVRAFLDLNDPVEQMIYWRRYLDTGRFRAAFDLLFSMPTLRSIYASSFLHFLPSNLAAVMRGRMERCFALIANRTNLYARALLIGEMPAERFSINVENIRLIHADAAAFLESEPAGSFDGFTLSNILDGASAAYEQQALRCGETRRRARGGGGAAQLPRTSVNAADKPRSRGSSNALGHR